MAWLSQGLAGWQVEVCMSSIRVPLQMPSSTSTTLTLNGFKTLFFFCKATIYSIYFLSTVTPNLVLIPKQPNCNATLMSSNSIYIYIYVDGDENGSALAKSGKKKIVWILMNYF